MGNPGVSLSLVLTMLDREQTVLGFTEWVLMISSIEM